MFDLKLESTIQMLVDHELDKRADVKILDDGSYQRLGIYIPVNLSASYYENDNSECVHIFMLFTGNVSVFYAVYPEAAINTVPNRWINTSNHDSLWRSDGFRFLHEIKMNMCEKVNPDIAPYELDTEARFSLGGSYPVRHCNVTFRENIEDGYGYKIVNVRLVGEHFNYGKA